jgi:phosphoribosylaminoimidazole (AIR) synthetase
MYKRFNNGMGYVIVVDAAHAVEAMETIEQHLRADIIGEVVEDSGKVLIESEYEPETV